MERGIFLRKQDSYKSILGILLLIYIGGVVMLNMVSTDKVFSEAENRRLEQAPTLSTSQVMDGRFTTNYEKYVSDQFPLRDFWVGVKSKSEKALGKKENNGVYLARDGYLMEKFEKPEEKHLKSKVDEINSNFSNMPNVDAFFILVPNSVKVLEDKLPPYAPAADELIYINKVKESLDDNINFVDIYDTLYANKDEYIYYKTDHHWTTKGAYLAYEKLMENMGIEPHGEDYFHIKKVTDSFYGSLYSKSGFRNIDPDSIELYIPKKEEVSKVEFVEEGKVSDSIYDMENLDKKDKYTVFLGGNHPLIKINTNINNGKKLLIIKDSYANSFIPFLTGHFSEIYVVDPRYYDKDLKILVDDNKIDNLLIMYNVKTFLND
jgi:hypothetical protein